MKFLRSHLLLIYGHVDPADPPEGEPLDLSDIRNSLRSLMWRHVGVERSGESLLEALRTVDGWCTYVLRKQFAGPQGWQLQNLLEVGRLMIHSALVRTETRGVHVRSDYPATSDIWRVHLCWQREVAEPWQTAIESGSPAVSLTGDCLPEIIDKYSFLEVSPVVATEESLCLALRNK
jgi:hypothetical protein